MILSAIITKDDLSALIASLMPLRIAIDERRGRSVTLSRPSLIELVPDQGLRLRGSAQIAWDALGVPIPVTLQTWQALLIPKIVVPHGSGRTRILAFEPIIEELDLKLVPGFLDDKIADAIQEGIEEHKHKLAWDFSRALSKRLPLPARMGPAMFEIAATEGRVQVTDKELRLAVRFEARIEKMKSAAVAAAKTNAGAKASDAQEGRLQSLGARAGFAR
jgi:hypothetical protein